MGKRLLFCLFLLVAVLVGSVGCRSMGPKAASANNNEPSPLPWNAPASWEGQTLGIPY